MTSLGLARRAVGEDAIPSFRRVSATSELDALFEDVVNVVVLRRSLATALRAEAQVVSSLVDGRALSVVNLEGGGEEVFASTLSGLPEMKAEILRWSNVLGDLTGCQQVGVRLARVEEAMCPRFHVDHVLLRVVCTFEGAGTQFLAEADVDRRWLGHAAEGRPDEVSGLLCAGAQIHQAEVGDVVFLKGESWPGNGGRGAVHRSPRATAKEHRLVMTLDAL
jgi:hypothetical protein